MKMRKWYVLVFVVLALSFVLAACAQAAPEVEEPGAAATEDVEATEIPSVATTPAIEAETPIVEETPSLEETPMTEETPDEEVNTVQVELVSFEIGMPETLPAGPTEFEVTNAGEDEHSFVIEGQGIEEGLDSNLQPDEAQTLQVDLEPGTYVVYCPVDDHREEGMELELTVNEE